MKFPAALFSSIPSISQSLKRIIRFIRSISHITSYFNNPFKLDCSWAFYFYESTVNQVARNSHHRRIPIHHPNLAAIHSVKGMYMFDCKSILISLFVNNLIQSIHLGEESRSNSMKPGKGFAHPPLAAFKELQQRIKRVNESAPSSQEEYEEEMARIRKDTVDFHGEMVLLVNYSNINYTGMAKILKKYDKRTGGLLRLLFIQKVLEQPFFTTELVSKLVKECETTIDELFPTTVVAVEMKEAAITMMGEGIFRNTVGALMTMKEIRKGSSTQSHFSLLALSLPDTELIRSFQLSSPIPII